MLSGEVKLGDRSFQVVNYNVITVLNEHYIMKLMRSTGLDSVLPTGEGESDDAYLIRLQSKLVDTLQLPALLGGYLLPNGKTETDWSLAIAAETTRFIEGLTRDIDKAEIHRMGYAVVLDFFRAGIDSLKHSQNVSKSAVPKTESPTSQQTIAVH